MNCTERYTCDLAPGDLKAHGGLRNGFNPMLRRPPPSRRQARAAACAEAPQELAAGACAQEPLRQGSCRHHATPSPRSVPTRMFRIPRMRARCRLVPTPCRIRCRFSGSATSFCPLRSIKGTFPVCRPCKPADIDAAPNIRRDFVETAVGTATESSRVQWPP